MLLPRFSVQQVDHGWDVLKKLARTIRDGNNFAKVGVLGNSKKAARRGSKLSSVDLALIHEYGTATIPARSFIGATFEKKKAELVLLLQRLAPSVYAGTMTVDQMLALAATRLAADMKNTIREGIDPPLKPGSVSKRVSRLLDVAEKRALAPQQGWKGFAALERVRGRRQQVRMASEVFGNHTGAEIPLVDTGQLVNSITYSVEKG